MNDFFNTIYYYTNSMYSIPLDSYMYLGPGYLHTGTFMLICSFIVCAVYYYLLAPVRKQTFWWFVYSMVNGGLNFFFAEWYTTSPLINNQVAGSDSWSYFDCTMFGVTNIIWSFIFFTVISLLIKWKSTAKYVPFQKF